MSPAEVPSGCVDSTNNEHALDRSVNDTKGEGLGMILIPGLDIEGEKRCGLSARSPLKDTCRVFFSRSVTYSRKAPTRSSSPVPYYWLLQKVGPRGRC